jgi:hypothetical protein
VAVARAATTRRRLLGGTMSPLTGGNSIHRMYAVGRDQLTAWREYCQRSIIDHPIAASVAPT